MRRIVATIATTIILVVFALFMTTASNGFVQNETDFNTTALNGTQVHVHLNIRNQGLDIFHMAQQNQIALCAQLKSMGQSDPNCP